MANASVFETATALHNDFSQTRSVNPDAVGRHTQGLQPQSMQRHILVAQRGQQLKQRVVSGDGPPIMTHQIDWNESAGLRLSSRLEFSVLLRKEFGLNTPDQEAVLRAMEDARRILAEYIASGRHDATRTVERLLTVVDKSDVVHALDRMNGRKVQRLAD